MHFDGDTNIKLTKNWGKEVKKQEKTEIKSPADAKTVSIAMTSNWPTNVFLILLRLCYAPGS